MFGWDLGGECFLEGGDGSSCDGGGWRTEQVSGGWEEGVHGWFWLFGGWIFEKMRGVEHKKSTAVRGDGKDFVD